MSSIGAHTGKVLRRVLPPAVAAPMIGYANLLLGERELSLVKVLASSTGVSLDVGANYGCYTYFLQRYSQQCIAFEPNPVCAAFLLAAYPRVDVRQLALSDVDKVTEFFVPGSIDGIENTRGRLQAAESAIQQENGVHLEVQTCPLDSLELSNVSFIKIDTEGHERQVLSGAIRTIETCHPRMIIECEERHSSGALAAVLGVLQPLGYIAFARTQAGYARFRTAEDGYHANQANNFLFVNSSDSILESSAARRCGISARDTLA